MRKNDRKNERTNETFSEHSTKGKNGIHSFRMTAINTDKTNVYNNQQPKRTNERKEQTTRETNNSEKKQNAPPHTSVHRTAKQNQRMRDGSSS